MGPPLDHHRHLARRARSRPRPHHGRTLSLLPARRLAGRPAQRSRDHPQRPIEPAHTRRHPPGLRLRARAAHHAQVHRQQRRDRRDLGAVAGQAGTIARAVEQGTARSPGRSGRSRARPTPSGRTQAKQLHADWWQARIARQKEIDASIAAKAEFEYLYDKPYDDKKGPRRRAVHGRKPVAAPRAGRG